SYTAPELALPEGLDSCVESTEFMRREHMQLLDDWRDQVVRDANRVYVSTENFGTEDAPVYRMYEASLQNTCMDCHTNKAEFCDKCHAAASVEPYCWDCHIEPKGN
ncbi:MAG: cytochrome C, partial [Desulfovibrio sp.]